MEAAAVCVCEGTSHHVDPFFLQFWNLKVNNAVGPDDEVGTEGMFRQTISGVYRRLYINGWWSVETRGVRWGACRSSVESTSDFFFHPCLSSILGPFFFFSPNQQIHIKRPPHVCERGDVLSSFVECPIAGTFHRLPPLARKQIDTSQEETAAHSALSVMKY